MDILKSIRSRFATYKDLGERAMGQLDDAQSMAPAPEGQNDIPTILRHLHGNMLSRFTNFLTEDGEKPWRDRDAEFERTTGSSRARLMSDWEAGWNCLFAAIDSMHDTQLEATVYVRGEAMTALDGLLRQLAHYSYHVGQIVTLCRQQCATWNSLSIPPGQSRQFNDSMRSSQTPVTGG